MTTFALRFDEMGWPRAITCNSVDVLHIVPGTVRNAACQDAIVAILNRCATQSEIDDLLNRAAQPTGQGWE